VIAGLQQGHDRAGRGHAGREGEPLFATLDCRHIGFQGAARRVLRARILVSLVFAERLLHVGGRLVDGDDDGARRGVGLLPGVDAEGVEASVAAQFHGVEKRTLD
jgi:hypothetical protein